MSDELTPEEREAIDRLPRERMPAGLEGRVVGAMRAHGFLAKRPRVVVLSHGRAAGLLAACVALVIGAYSIGLQRGDGRQALPASVPAETVPTERDDAGRADAPATPGEREAEPSATGMTLEKYEAPEEAAPAAGKLRAERKRTAAEGHDAARSVVETPAPAVAFDETARFAPDRTAPGVADVPLAFILGGTPVTVEAPDSVRVEQDEQGRMLIIHTSDGIIRIRVTGER